MSNQSVSPIHDPELVNRMARFVRRGRDFSLGFVEISDTSYRQALLQELKQKLIDFEVHWLDIEAPSHVANLKQALDTRLADINNRINAGSLKPAPCLISLANLDAHLSETDAGIGLLRWFNLYRDQIGKDYPHTWLLWVSESALVRFHREAPDFWRWNSAVFPLPGQDIKAAYNLIPQTSYEALQRFVAVEKHRNQRLNALMDGILTDQNDIDPLLVQHISKATAGRFKAKNVLTADVKLEILYRVPELRLAENRYICYLANYSDDRHFLSNIAIKNTKQIFALINDGLTRVRKLRAIYGNLRSMMYHEYQPTEWHELFIKNRELLFNEIKSMTEARLDLI